MLKVNKKKMTSMINKKLDRIMPTNGEMNNVVNRVLNSNYGKRVVLKNSTLSKTKIKSKIKKMLPSSNLLKNIVKQQAHFRMMMMR